MARYARRGRRSARRRFRRRSTRRVRGGRVGRAHTNYVAGTFRAENVYACPITATKQIAGQFAFWDEIIPMYDAYIPNGGTNTAYRAQIWCFRPNLTQLTRAITGDAVYLTHASIYDQVRVLSATVVLKPPMGMATLLEAPVPSLGTAIDFTGLPIRQPDISFIDRDADIQVTGNTNNDGDYTTLCMSRYGAKVHRFGRPIARKLYAKQLMPVSDVYGNTNNALGPAGFASVKSHWMSNVQTSAYIGDILLALSYKGGDLGVVAQPRINYSCQTLFKVQLRMPIYG